MFIQGITLRISITSEFKRNMANGCSPLKATWKCTLKVEICSYIHPTDFESLRYLGVLAYFSVSGLVNSLVLLYIPVWHSQLGFISRWRARAEYAEDYQVWHM